MKNNINNINKFECKNITKKFNEVNNIILNNISIEIYEGECIGILGHNGSGKSTLMSILAGMTKFNSGEILYNNILLSKESKNNKNNINNNLRLNIGYVPQTPLLIEDLTVFDNLSLWASIYNIKDFKKNINNLEVLQLLKIDEMLNKKISVLSGGMKKKVSIAIALMNNPRFLILDEAFAALDANTIDIMTKFLSSKVKNKELGILYSSHNIQEIIDLCTKIIVIKDGNIVYFNNLDDSNKDSNKINNLDDNLIKFLYSKF